MDHLYPAIIFVWVIVFPFGWYANLRASDYRGNNRQRMWGNAMVGYGCLFIGSFLGFFLIFFESRYDLSVAARFFLTFGIANVVALVTTFIIIKFAKAKESY